MDVDERPSSGRESRQRTKSEGYSEYGETSGIASGTQSPSIIVPTAADDEVLADDSGNMRGDGAGDGDDAMQMSDEGYGQEETESDHGQGQGQSRPQREVKFSDQEQTSADQVDPEISDEESADETEKQRPGTPEESQSVGVTQGQPFTIFAILPTKEVITLRDVPSGSTVYHVQSLIELSGGIPSECYSLVSSTTADKLSADTKFVLGENVTAGATMRIIPHLAWLEVFRAIWHNDIDFIHKTGEACLMCNMNQEEAGAKENTYRNRLSLCLFMACARGEKEMSQILIEMGADVNGMTLYGNTALHAAARHNQLVIVDFLLKNGATSSLNIFGKAVTEVAKEAGAFSCERYLRLHKWSLTGQNYVISPKPSPRSKPTSATSQRSSQSGRFSNSHVFLSKGADNMRTDQKGGFFSNKAVMSSSNLPNIGRRCKSAPVERGAQKSRPFTTQTSIKGGSKYHKECLQRGSVITVSKSQKDYLGADIVKYIDHPMVTGTVENFHVYVPSVVTDTDAGTNAASSNGVSRGKSPRDLEKDNAIDPDRTVLAETLYRWENDQNNRQLQQKPRAKSASARPYKSHFHKYLEPEEPVYYSRVKELRERRTQTAVLSPEEEERRMRNDAAYQRWMARKTVAGAFSPQEKEGQLILPSSKYTKEENERAFQIWLEDKEDEEPQKMNCQERRMDREKVVQLGCTDTEDVVLTSPEENHLSYQRWLRSQAEKGRGSSRADEPSDVLRRRTEEKRQKTILNVKAYEEWLEEIEEEKQLKRKIAMEKKQAAQEANEETKKQRTPKQVPFSKWLSMKETKKQEERKKQKMEEAKKAEEERLRKENWSTGTNVTTFKQWYILQGKPKPVKMPNEGSVLGQTRAEHMQREKEERAKMARESFDSWAIQKALQDLQLEKQRLRQEERKLDMMRGGKQTRLQ